MKKIIFILFFVIFILDFSNSYAYTTSNEDPTNLIENYNISKLEENACFQLLNEAVKNDSDFKDINILQEGDLSKVVLNEQTKTTGNFSTYNGFRQNGEKFLGFMKKFYARRNNIGTLIFDQNQIVSNIAGFGKDSNFDFPLSASQGVKSFGDKYQLGNGKQFKEYIIYTHHLKADGNLLSCGIVKINPLGNNTFGTINESKYMTNVFNGDNCSSGFEGEYKKKYWYKRQSKYVASSHSYVSTITNYRTDDFYQMKADVCVKDYADKDLVKIEVLSLAYNNKSYYFNEYITHPLQVEAMKDTGNRSGGLIRVMQDFRKKAQQTGLYLITGYSPNISNYDRTENKKGFLDLFIPQAHAKLDDDYFDETPQERLAEAKKTKGMMMYENIPYYLYEKMLKIPNEEFKEYLKIALSPQLEILIKKRQEEGIILSSFEKTFLECNMPYKERTDVIIDFLEKLDLEKFNINNLSYINKKFGDCIIPYPDKTNLDKEVEISFESNKLQAQKLNGTYKYEKNPDFIKSEIDAMNSLELEREKNLNLIAEKFNQGILKYDEFEKSKNEILNEYNAKLSKIENNIKEKEKRIGNTKSYTKIINKEKSNMKKYIIPGGLGILGIILISFGIFIKRRKK